MNSIKIIHPSVHLFFSAYPIQPIPAVIWQEARHTLDRSPAHPRAMTEWQTTILTRTQHQLSYRSICWTVGGSRSAARVREPTQPRWWGG